MRNSAGIDGRLNDRLYPFSITPVIDRGGEFPGLGFQLAAENISAVEKYTVAGSKSDIIYLG
jgi:hypothetical protein